MEVSREKKIPRTVKVLSGASALNDAASEMIVPLLPMFVTGVLGLGPAVLGAMEGLAETTAVILKYFSGVISDIRKNKKGPTIFGYLISNIFRPLIAISSSATQIIALRMGDRVGKGIRTAPRDALIAAAVDERDRGRSFGFHRAADNFGAVLGSLAASALLAFGLSLRSVFLLSVVPGVATVLLLIFGIRENNRPDREAISDIPDAGVDSSIPAIKPRKDFVPFLLSMLIFTLGNSSDTFLILRAHELGMKPALAPILWMVLHLVKTVSVYYCGVLADRIGHKKSILIGWAVYAVAYLSFALADAAWQMWLLLILYGFYYGFTEAPERALTASMVPKDRRGHGFGAYHLSIGVAALPASLIAGGLWENGGPLMAFGFGAACAAVAAVVLTLFVNEKPSRD